MILIGLIYANVIVWKFRLQRHITCYPFSFSNVCGLLNVNSERNTESDHTRPSLNDFYIFSGVITSVTPSLWKNSLWGEEYYENAITTDDVFSHPDKPIPNSREFAEVRLSDISKKC